MARKRFEIDLCNADLVQHNGAMLVNTQLRIRHGLMSKLTVLTADRPVAILAAITNSSPAHNFHLMVIGLKIESNSGRLGYLWGFDLEKVHLEDVKGSAPTACKLIAVCFCLMPIVCLAITNTS